MDVLIIFEWIYKLLFEPVAPGAELAIPWSALIPVAVSTAASGIRSLRDRPRRRADERRAAGMRVARDEGLENLQEMIAELRSRAGGVEGHMDMEDLYGDQLQMIMDRVGGDQSEAVNQVSRALMAGGGDVSGSAQAMIAELTQSGQRTIGDAIRDFTELTDRRNLAERTRGDQILTQTLGRQAQLFGGLHDISMDYQGRVDRRRTAGRQFTLDMLGLGSSIGGQIHDMRN